MPPTAIGAFDLREYSMGKKMVIWDWNGTILDDIQICFDIANTMRSARSMPPIPDLVSYRDPGDRVLPGHGLYL